MYKRRYQSPIFMISSGGDDNVPGDGTGQGSIAPQGMTYEEWWEEVAWGGENPDADYNGDGEINQEDYDYYIEHELWNG